MKRIKVIADATDLVPLLRAIDTDTKRKVFQEIVSEWRTIRYIGDKYGDEGKEVLLFFEKLKLIETKWDTSGKKPEKVYKAYFVQFHVNITCTVHEISEILFVAMMPQEEFEKIEKNIIEMTGEHGKFAGDIAESLKISQLMLKALVKRSTKLDLKGLRIEIVKPT